MSHSLNPHEKSLRKQWLVISIIAILAWPLITLGFMSFISRKEHVPAGVYWVYFGVALLTVLLFYVLYRCAYVKPGIRFLTFVLIVGPLLKLKATFDALKVGHDHVTLIALAVNLGFYAWWYILSLKLRKMNKKIS
ncbi:MAG TPA: hypothetical protein VIJ14_04990 [Rhabdochlamydiaceae bacterium]